ncbi:Sialidase [Trinorchestia longiramus]|nr:Sialidase [Trinorchestia longiramus]
MSTGFESRKTLVYDALEPAGAAGERALYSRDVSVYGDSVLQFEVKIGCGKPVPSTHNISLQYSTDNGASWKSVKDIPQESGENYLPSLSETPRASWHRNQRTAGHSDFGARHEMQSDYSQQTNKNSYSHPLYPDYFNGAIVSGEDKIESESGQTTRKPQHRVSPDCLHELKAPSVYYWNSAPEWRREVIPLSNLQICGNVRFRWIELGDPSMPSLVWALDNIYLGPACIYHCGGHGLCINGDTCLCDEGYDEDASCLSLSGNPSSFRLSFDNSTTSSQHQVHQQVLQVHQKMEQVQRVSGGHVTTDCSVIRGAALVFREDGERSLVTHNLDTSDGSVVQFYLRLGCDPLSSTSFSATEVQPILLQFSTDGGVSWTLIAELTKDIKTSEGAPHTSHFTVPLPDAARTNSTQLRWWQPSDDGTFDGTWAIDEIYVGSRSSALSTFSPPTEGSWLLTAGASMKPACGHTDPVLAFEEESSRRGVSPGGGYVQGVGGLGAANHAIAFRSPQNIQL